MTSKILRLFFSKQCFTQKSDHLLIIRSYLLFLNKVLLLTDDIFLSDIFF